eukprot:g2339.t1
MQARANAELQEENDKLQAQLSEAIKKAEGAETTLLEERGRFERAIDEMQRRDLERFEHDIQVESESTRSLPMAQPREAAFVPAHDSPHGDVHTEGAGHGEESETTSATRLRRLRRQLTCERAQLRAVICAKETEQRTLQARLATFEQEAALVARRAKAELSAAVRTRDLELGRLRKRLSEQGKKHEKEKRALQAEVGQLRAHVESMEQLLSAAHAAARRMPEQHSDHQLGLQPEQQPGQQPEQNLEQRLSPSSKSSPQPRQHAEAKQEIFSGQRRQLHSTPHKVRSPLERVVDPLGTFSNLSLPQAENMKQSDLTAIDVSKPILSTPGPGDTNFSAGLAQDPSASAPRPTRRAPRPPASGDMLRSSSGVVNDAIVVTPSFAAKPSRPRWASSPMHCTRATIDANGRVVVETVGDSGGSVAVPITKFISDNNSATVEHG